MQRGQRARRPHCFLLSSAALPPRGAFHDAFAAEAPKPNAIFDESGNFLLYPTLLGIKVGAGLLSQRGRSTACSGSGLPAQGEPLAPLHAVASQRRAPGPAGRGLSYSARPCGPRTGASCGGSRRRRLLALPPWRRRAAMLLFAVRLLSHADNKYDALSCPSPTPQQVVNLVTNRVVKIIGKVESTERFLQLALYQASVPTPRFQSGRQLPALLLRCAGSSRALGVFPEGLIALSGARAARRPSA